MNIGKFSSLYYSSSVVSAILLLSAFSCSVHAEDMPPTSFEVKEVLKQLKYTKGSFSTAVRDKTVTVSTYAAHIATDKDLKVKAILIAKHLMDKFAAVSYVRVVFYDQFDRKSYKYVSVSRGTIESFGDGHINDSQMIASLNVASGLTRAKSSKTSGSKKNSRSRFQKRIKIAKLKIDTLRLEGYSVLDVQEMYNYIESLVGTPNDYKVQSELGKLENLLVTRYGASISNLATKQETKQATKRAANQGAERQRRLRNRARQILQSRRGFENQRWAVLTTLSQFDESQWSRLEVYYARFNTLEKQLRRIMNHNTVDEKCSCRSHRELLKKYRGLENEIVKLADHSTRRRINRALSEKSS